MEQASTPLSNADLDGQEMTAQPPKYFWTVKPIEITAWTKKHKPELTILTGMGLTSLLISGAAMAVLMSPNLGQRLTYKPLIDDATLAASRRISLGEQLLGQVARVLEIEIIETQGPELGRHPGAAPAMTIVAQADKAASMPEADLAVGFKAMVMAAGAGLGVTGLMRLIPLMPFSALGPRRRQPLSQRLKPADGVSQPLAPIVANRPVGPNQALIPGALTSLPTPSVSLSNGLPTGAPAAAPAIPGHRARANAKPQQQRSPREVLRRHFAPRIGPGRTWIDGLQPGHSGSQTSGTVETLGGEGPKQTPRSQAPAQPVSFAPLNAFADSVLLSGPKDSPRHTALWSNRPSETLGKQVPVPPAQFDFLDQLDMRRQYPLEDV